MRPIANKNKIIVGEAPYSFYSYNYYYYSGWYFDDELHNTLYSKHRSRLLLLWQLCHCKGAGGKYKQIHAVVISLEAENHDQTMDAHLIAISYLVPKWITWSFVGIQEGGRWPTRLGKTSNRPDWTFSPYRSSPNIAIADMANTWNSSRSAFSRQLSILNRNYDTSFCHNGCSGGTVLHGTHDRSVGIFLSGGAFCWFTILWAEWTRMYGGGTRSTQPTKNSCGVLGNFGPILD